jgi:hypothetical protein
LGSHLEVLAGRRLAADHTGVAYELAYEARVAADALRFAIKQLEGELSPGDSQQTAFVLLDAFDRLVRAEHYAVRTAVRRLRIVR